MLFWIFHNDAMSWILHLLMFFILSRCSGMKFWWLVVFVLGIEMSQSLEYSWNNPLNWFLRFDTLMDILCGYLGILIDRRF